jgi:cell wall hydrolase
VLDFSIDTSDPTAQGGPVSPDSMKRKRALADALIQQGSDTSPIAGGKWGGIARIAKGLLGGYESGQLDNQERAGLAASARNFSSGFSGLAGGEPDVTPGNPPLATGVPLGMVKPGMPQPDTSGKIYRNDEPSPLDPPSGEDLKNLQMMVIGEAGNEPQQGKNAVASVARTRAVDGGYGGNTPTGVVTAPNQFEPFNTPEGRARMARGLMDPKQLASANDAIDQAYGTGKYVSAGPNDPTEGMTHFYSPKGQAALGRPAPAWAGGDSVTIGGHVFNSPDDKIPQNAQAAQGQLPPRPIAQGPQVAQNGPANVNVRNWANSVLNDPYANASQKQVAASVLQKALTPKEDAWSSAGNGYFVNSRTGDVKKGYEPPDDKKPASVAEYEYYTKNFQPTADQPRPMPYDTWSTAKSRAGATNISNNIDMNSGQTYDKQLAEGLGKSHAALANGVEDAQSRARDLAAMQGAVDAIQKNGGTTGGMGQAQILELKKTLNAGAAGLGVTTPFDEKDISDKEFLTKFNRQIAGAQAKGAVGSRVTNFEMSNYLKANPGLEMSVTGNQRLIGIQSQIEQRNVAVGNQIRDATAQAISRGQKIDPVTVQKIITNYDQAHHVQDPITGQDLTQSYTLPEFQKQPGSSNEALSTDHSANIKKLGGKSYQKIDGVWHEVN